MSRDGFKCNCCGNKEKQLHVHHRTYFNGLKPWEYDDSLLTTLCDDCHENIHRINDILKLQYIIFSDYCYNSFLFNLDKEYLMQIEYYYLRTFQSFFHAKLLIDSRYIYFSKNNSDIMYFFEIGLIDNENKLIFVNNIFVAS